MSQQHFTYIVRCADTTYYCGYTTDLERRVGQHNRGEASKYTRSRLPVELVYFEEYITKSEALAREVALKKLSRKKKAQLEGLGRADR